MTAYAKNLKDHKGSPFATQSDVSDAVSGKADVSHRHAIADVENLAAELAAKTTQAEVDAKIAALGSVFTLKGRVDDLAALNALTGQKTGWVWLVGLENSEKYCKYVRSSSGTWVHLGDTTEANLSNYFTKSEINAALALKADAANVYTKAETDAKLSGKVNAADVYGKGEMDTKLAGKASSIHTHGIADVSGLQSALDAKANTAHTHDDFKMRLSILNRAAIVAGNGKVSLSLPADATVKPLVFMLIRKTNAEPLVQIFPDLVKNGSTLEARFYDTADNRSTVYDGAFADSEGTNTEIHVCIQPETAGA